MLGTDKFGSQGLMYLFLDQSIKDTLPSHHHRYKWRECKHGLNLNYGIIYCNRLEIKQIGSDEYQMD